MKAGKKFGVVAFGAIVFLAVLAARADGAGQWGHTPVGHWETDSAGLPVFVYTMDEFNDPRAYYPTSLGPSNDHWFLLGNGRMVALAYNHGEVVIYSGERGATWLNERDPKHHRFAGGYGFLKEGDTIISMRYPDRPEGCEYERRFGVGYFEKTLTCPDVKITQTITAPVGEVDSLLSTVEIENLSDQPREMTWYEYWDVNPHYFGTMIEIAGEGGESTGEGEGLSSASPMLEKITKLFPGDYTLSRLVARTLHSWRAGMTKDFVLKTDFENNTIIATLGPPEPPIGNNERSELNYYPYCFFLSGATAEQVSGYETVRSSLFNRKGEFAGKVSGGLLNGVPLKNAESAMVLKKEFHLDPENQKDSEDRKILIYFIGYEERGNIKDQIETAVFYYGLSSLIEMVSMILDKDVIQPGLRLWRVDLPKLNLGDQAINQEMLWHAYYLRAMATYDDYFENRIISQGCSYQYMMGMNIAARDPLQHMLPAVYLEPELAKDVLRYTLRMMDGKGFIPYGIKGVGMRTAGGNPFPSDTILYLMLALDEYVTATRDFGFLSEGLPYYPKEDGATGTVMEHMKKGWRHFRDDVGAGANGLVKLRNSDWNDSFIAEEKSLDPDLDLRAVEGEAESVLNTAMAVYILPRFAALVRSQGETEWAGEIDARAEAFRQALAKQWNGRWYNRAVLPGGKVVGADRIYLEQQPWAILGNALSPEEEQGLAETMRRELSSRSPIGAVMRWPPLETARLESAGKGTNGGVWYSLRYPLIMAYARQRPEYAWDEFIKMTNHTHAEAYPDVWVGQWSGPDAYNAENSQAPGWTWDALPFSGAMMDFPIMCGHAHAAPWFALIKLMGIRPDPDGFTIAPRVPQESFSVKTALIELERGPGSIKGALNPTTTSDVVWRVEVPSPVKSVLVNGEKVEGSMEDNRVVFRSPAGSKARVEWSANW